MKETPWEIRMAMAAAFEQFRPAAAQIMQGGIMPDQIIGTHYMARWWLAKIEDQHDIEELGPLQSHTIPTRDLNCYLHRLSGNDPDHMHDHPWPNASLVLEGEYLEHTPLGTFHRVAGDMVFRQPEELHRLEIVTPVWSLFITGRKLRDWGFIVDGKWTPWREYTARFPARA